MITTEERNQYSNQGEKLKQIFKKTIGEQLLAERKKRNMCLEEITRKTQIKQHKIEKMEFGIHKFHWCILARLLKLYKKKLEINFIDIK